jgi:hypothetical protein
MIIPTICHLQGDINNAPINPLKKKHKKLQLQGDS